VKLSDNLWHANAYDGPRFRNDPKLVHNLKFNFYTNFLLIFNIKLFLRNVLDSPEKLICSMFRRNSLTSFIIVLQIFGTKLSHEEEGEEQDNTRKLLKFIIKVFLLSGSFRNFNTALVLSRHIHG